MDVKIASDWKEILSEEFEKPYFRELTSYGKNTLPAGYSPEEATFFVPSTNARSTNSKW